MTSKLTREWLQHQISEIEVAGITDSNTLAAFKLALASMDSEPVAWDYEWASCITCEGPQDFKRVIEREAPPEWAIEEGQARNVIPLYRHAQQPVVQPVPASGLLPGEMDEPDGADYAEMGDDAYREDCAYTAGWNACRIAMLQAGTLTNEGTKQAWTDIPDIDNAIIMLDRIDTLESCDDDRIEAVKAVLRGLAGNSPVIPDTWIPVSERMPEDGECVVIVDSDHGCFYGGAVALYRAPHFHLMNGVEASNHDGEAVVVTSFEATHWMPLPAGPQEVKGE